MWRFCVWPWTLSGGETCRQMVTWKTSAETVLQLSTWIRIQDMHWDGHQTSTPDVNAYRDWTWLIPEFQGPLKMRTAREFRLVITMQQEIKYLKSLPHYPFCGPSRAARRRNMYCLHIFAGFVRERGYTFDKVHCQSSYWKIWVRALGIRHGLSA